MPSISKLVSGFRIFKATTYPQQKDIIEHLIIKGGQKPSTMVISCVDISVAPAALFASNPGELYVINNIGGLVPKFDTTGVHGIVSAIEYAVTVLEVENIIVLGHNNCSSIKTIMSDKFASPDGLSVSMKTWLSIAAEARDAVKKQLNNNPLPEQEKACEHESLIISLRNLLTYPYVKEGMSKNKLNIYGWHFDVETGEIMAFDPDTTYFEPIS